MLTSPLFTHRSPDSIIAWRSGQAVTIAQFLRDVDKLCRILPTGMHILNACSDRYHFAVGLAAALVSRKISLLPSSQTPETVRQLASFAPDVFCLTDSPGCSIALPRLLFSSTPDLTASDEQEFSVPQIAGDQVVSYVFTSGSTGVPVPHRKTWGALVRNVQVEAQLCGLSDGRQHAIVGTVPAQHMYGFESTILMVLQSGNALVSDPAFYPADICAAIDAVPRPRALVSTPVHMRSVVSAGLEIPAVDLILSATAPLSSKLARELEAAFQAPLLEIYGSTETGQIALRKRARSEEWELFPGVELIPAETGVWARGGHIEQPTALQDVIEPVSDRRFLLHGRTADLVNIAGKRNSLAYLDLQLNALPGVIDGAFFMPDEKNLDGVTRLTAFVVAPDLSPATLLAALRECIDPVFLPRPLIFLDALPRNATGKLPRSALQTLARQHLREPLAAPATRRSA